MAPRKPSTKTSGKKRKGNRGEGPTPLATIRAIELSLATETIAAVPLPRGAKRDEHRESGRMTRIRPLPILRRLDPKDDSFLRNDRTSYKEANLGYMRGSNHHDACAQCENGDGTQHLCIILLGEWGGACTNCSYDGDAKKCEFWRPKKKSAKKGGKGKQADSDEDDDNDNDEDDQDPAFWDGEDDNEDDQVGGDDGDAGAVPARLAPAIGAY